VPLGTTHVGSRAQLHGKRVSASIGGRTEISVVLGRRSYSHVVKLEKAFSAASRSCTIRDVYHLFSMKTVKIVKMARCTKSKVKVVAAPTEWRSSL